MTTMKTQDNVGIVSIVSSCPSCVHVVPFINPTERPIDTEVA